MDKIVGKKEKKKKEKTRRCVIEIKGLRTEK